MSYPVSSSLLDGIVLAVVERESTYGYRITQDVQRVLDISESTLYPVLRRLQKDGCLTTYDAPSPSCPRRSGPAPCAITRNILTTQARRTNKRSFPTSARPKKLRSRSSRTTGS